MNNNTQNGAAAVELAGGSALVLDWKTRWAAAVIASFLIPATLIFHNPAGLPAAEAQAQVIDRLTDILIFGGILVLVAFGPGRWSIDKEQRS